MVFEALSLLISQYFIFYPLTVGPGKVGGWEKKHSSLLLHPTYILDNGRKQTWYSGGHVMKSGQCHQNF